MGGWKRALLLLLLRLLTPAFGADRKEAVAMRSGAGWKDVPLCNKEQSDDRCEEAGCELRHPHVSRFGRALSGSCPSGYRLVLRDQKLFLRLTNLKPEDAGSFICKCSGGAETIHLNVTVEDSLPYGGVEDKNGTGSAVISATMIIIVSVCVVIFIT